MYVCIQISPECSLAEIPAVYLWQVPREGICHRAASLCITTRFPTAAAAATAAVAAAAEAAAEAAAAAAEAAAVQNPQSKYPVGHPTYA